MTLPLRRPYELQGGRLRFEQLDSTMVRIDTDEGVSGWGEACPWGSTYLPAFPKGVRAGICPSSIIPLVVPGLEKERENRGDPAPPAGPSATATTMVRARPSMPWTGPLDKYVPSHGPVDVVAEPQVLTVTKQHIAWA